MSQTWTRYLPAFMQRKLEGRHILQKAIGNTGWLMADQAVRMGGGLLIGIWMARYLGPEQYGLFSYAIAFVMLFSSFAGLGLESIVIRKIVRDPSSRDEVLGTSFFMMLSGGLVVFGLAMGTVYLVRPDDTLSHWLVGITVAGTIFQGFNAIDFWFESQVQSKFAVLAKDSAFLLTGIVKIAFILMNAPLVAFAWAGLAEVALGSAGLVISYRANGYRVKAWRFSPAMAVQLLRDSWPMVFSSVVTMIYLRIDQVMLGDMVGSGEVGVYSAAVRLADAWYAIPFAICTSVFPAIVEAGTVDEELFHAQLQKLYNLMALISYAVAIPVTFLSGWIVTALFGAAYAKSGPLLAMLIWAGLFTNLGAARSVFLISMNWTKVYLVSMSLGCILNLALNYLLIPIYGAMGAVVASLISYWFAVHGSCFIFKPLRRTGHMLTKAMLYPRVW